MDARRILRLAGGPARSLRLVNGRPLKMMAGAKNVHDVIVVNILAELARTQGTGCRPFIGDGASKHILAIFVDPT